MDDSTSCSRRWADLPEDIVFEISRRVDVRWPSDFPCRLRSVCTSWRSSVSPPPPRTQLDFPITVPNLDCTHRVNKKKNKPNFSVKKSTYYLISPLPRTCTEASSSGSDQQGWIIRVNESEPRTWRLLNPMKDKEGLFLECKPPIRAEINLLNYRIQELAQSYSLVNEHGYNVCHKVVVSLSAEDDGNFTATMAVIVESLLSFWKTGETHWRIWSETKHFVKIASHKGKFYDVEYDNGYVYEIDREDMNSCVIVAAPPGFPKHCGGVTRGMPLYFFEWQGCLYYIVHGYNYHSDKCSVSKCSVSIFVLNEDHCRWESVMSIEDQVFFLLQEACLAVPATDLGRDSRGGWICFESCWGPSAISEFPKTSAYEGLEKLYKLGYQSYDELFCMCEFRKTYEGYPTNQALHYEMIRFSGLPYKDYTSIFFPPPSWIKWRCPARDNGIVSMRYLPKVYSKLGKLRGIPEHIYKMQDDKKGDSNMRYVIA